MAKAENSITLYVGDDSNLAVVRAAETILADKGISLSKLFRNACEAVVNEEIKQQVA